MLIRSSVPGFLNKVYKSAGSIFIPDCDAVISKHQNIIALLGTPQGDRIIPASNIVTTDGDLFYAQLMSGEATTNTFNTHEMASAGTPAKGANRSAYTLIASTEKVEAAGYPQTNDPDSDNTGAGVTIRTTLASYTKADFTAASITHGIVTNPAPAASELLLTGYAFAVGFGKTANDTLKVFVNHQALGV